MTLRSLMLLALVANLATFAVRYVAVRDENRAQDVISDAYQNRYQIFSLADELQQSSAELTRFARAYVDTSNPEYLKDYLLVAAVRDGKEPRPAEYGMMFWDLLAVPVKRTGPSIPLMELIKRQGVTAQELALLTTAKKRSDDLMVLEKRAFQELEGTKADSPTASRRNMAVQMLYSPEYMDAKVRIMEPLFQFRESLDRRTAAEAATAEAIARTKRQVLLAANLIILLTLALTALALVMRVLAPISRMRIAMQNVASGNEPASVPALSQRDEIGDMARALVRFQAAMRRKNELEAAMAREAAESAKAMERVVRHFTDVIAASIMGHPPPRPLFPAKERENGAVEELTILLADMAETVGDVAAKARAAGANTPVETFGDRNDASRDAAGKQRTRYPGRILVIDDEIDITDALEISMSRLGYAVTAFNDPKAALDAFLARISDWDIIILDELMPGMRGSDLAPRIKEIVPSIPIILVSGSTQGEAWAISGAIDLRLDKPLSASDLDAHIQDFLTRN